jgi:SAM-dependent methyltransferase
MSSELLNNIKDYWNRRPCNIRHSNKELGSKEYFDEVEHIRYFNEPHNYRFAEFHKWKNLKVLEIGCGIGTDAVNFARAGADYTGIDISGESIALAKRRFEVYNLNGRLIECNAESIDSVLQENEKFDLIYSFGVIHHSPNPEKIIYNLPKYMHKASVAKVMLYAKHSWKNILIEGGVEQPEAQSNCPRAETYTIDDVKKMFAYARFSDVQVEQDFIFKYNTEKYIQKEYVVEPWFESMSPEMFKIMEQNLGWHLLINAKL